MSERATSVSVSRDYGNYNLCSTGKEWQLRVVVRFDSGPAVCVSGLFDEEPDADLRPSQALDVLEERLNNLWFSSHKKKDLAAIERLRALDLDQLWLRREIKWREEALEDLRDELAALEARDD